MALNTRHMGLETGRVRAYSLLMMSLLRGELGGGCFQVFADSY